MYKDKKDFRINLAKTKPLRLKRPAKFFKDHLTFFSRCPACSANGFAEFPFTDKLGYSGEDVVRKQFAWTLLRILQTCHTCS